MSDAARTPSPRRPRGRLLVVAAVLITVVVAAGACSPAGPGTPGPTPSPTFSPIPPGDASGVPIIAPSTAPSASPAAGLPGLLLEVTTEGGFINPVASIGELPAVVVDTDGRIYTPTSGMGDASSPLIPAVDVRDTGPTGAAAILAAMKTAGLDTEGAGGGIAADAGTTVFTAMIDGGTVVNRVSGGGMGPGGPGRPGASGAPAASAAPGAAAMALLARLADPAEIWGAASAPAASAFAPSGYRVYLAPSDGSAAGSVLWPAQGDPATFGSPAAADFGVTGLRTGIVTGNDATALARALGTARSGTLITSSSKAVFQAWIRPLFPDELAG